MMPPERRALVEPNALVLLKDALAKEKLMTDSLTAGQSILQGSSITSTDGRFMLSFQNDGNLVLYSVGGGGLALWAASTSGPGEAIMQGDGNFVVYEPDGRTAKWASGSGGPNSWLIVQNDGNLVIYNAAGKAVWATGTNILAEAQVPDFLPSTSGFHFGNAYPDGTNYPIVTLPVVGTLISGDAGNGLCGGFVFAALDLFSHKPRLVPPTQITRPAEGSDLFKYLTERLIDSFGSPPDFDNAAKVIQWIQLPTHDVIAEVLEGAGLSRRMVDTEWPAIKADIDAGNPSPLNLVGNPGKKAGDIAGIIQNLGSCHQVLAFGYRLHSNGPLILKVYDCNDPDDDHSEIWLMPFSQATKHNTITITSNAVTAILSNLTVRGLFRSVYTRHIVPAVALLSTVGAAAVNSDGHMEVFASRTDNALWHIWQTLPAGPWSNWSSLP